MDKSIKAARLADQIRDYLARWIHQEYLQYGLSITQVTLTPDLGKATVWVEVFNAENMKPALKELSKKSGHYQGRLIRELGRRAVPALSFKPDASDDFLAHFDELLKQ